MAQISSVPITRKKRDELGTMFKRWNKLRKTEFTCIQLVKKQG